jgi:hypothetical protein
MNGHYGYKKCGNYIVKLLIPKNAVTNELRPGIVNAFRAKYRTNLAYVVEIIGYNPPKYIVSTFHKKWLKYEIGKKVECADFDYNLKKICAPGIHYFLSYEQALNYDGSNESWIGNKINGIVFYYDGNGKNIYTMEYKNKTLQNVII